jgi:alpha-mannosidase
MIKHLFFGIVLPAVLTAGIVTALSSGAPVSGDQAWLQGYVRPLSGETLSYHSPHKDRDTSLLVRALDTKRFIEWETQSLPGSFDQPTATFVWMFGIDVNPDTHSYDLLINDKAALTFRNPVDDSTPDWTVEGKSGVRLRFRSILTDKYGDFMGYAFLTVPTRLCRKGPLRLRIEGESAGSRTWYMTFKESLDDTIRIQPESALLHSPDGPRQTLRVEIIHLDEPAQATILCEERSIPARLEMGFNAVQIALPAVDRPKEIPLEIRISDREPVLKTALIGPVKPMTCYLIHHSHVDIGYTHVQTEVERIQWDHLEQAVRLADESSDFPTGTQFKWNVEVMWALDSYLKSALPGKREAMISAVREGWIGLDGLYGNVLTGICRPEEMMRLLDAGRRAARLCGVPLESAMITDIPGWSWGLVPALASAGIKYLDLGTNSGHRIGSILEEWADRPFYWVSPSGEEKVLCWIAGKSYAWFHTGLGYGRLEKRLREKPILDYMEELTAADYPYDMVPFRYNIGSDNGPPDRTLAATVREWNRKFISPRIVISTTGEAFRIFEDRHAAEIPVMRGDFTGYWEDGAASSALETNLNRQAAERLVQAEILWSMREPEGFPHEKFEEAWRNVLLYSEHTWGSWNSISEPDAPFTQQQWRIKQSFAHQADSRSRSLVKEAFPAGPEGPVKTFHVYNTQSWQRNDLILIPSDWELAGDRVKDDRGSPVPSQRLSTGELAVLVPDIPPLGARRFSLEPGPPSADTDLKVGQHSLSNSLLSVTIDPDSGDISSLKQAAISAELAGLDGGSGLNSYHYVKGRDPVDPRTSDPPGFRIKEKGPLVASLEIHSEAPGADSLIREVRLTQGLGRLDIVNTIEKKAVREPEGVHIGFPFSVPRGIVSMDTAWGIFRPEFDQIPGSCKNYFSVQRWVDISNQEFGITLITPDAPLVEMGRITADPTSVGWIRKQEHSGTLFSYIMNNYWETNYKASQEGRVSFRYSLLPHGPFSPEAAKRNGFELSQPLIVVPVSDKAVPPGSLFNLDPTGIVVTSIRSSRDGRALMVRLFNSAGRPEKAAFIWKRFKPGAVYLSSSYEDRIEEIELPLAVPAYGIRTLRLER